ncbi:hypothetical protein CsSME_00035584 [Camellia sinensis var. sinensis]
MFGDCWDASFDVAFPHLYRVAHSHSISTASLACFTLAPISWNFKFARSLNDRETCELVSFYPGLVMFLCPRIRVISGFGSYTLLVCFHVSFVSIKSLINLMCLLFLFIKEF